MDPNTPPNMDPNSSQHSSQHVACKGFEAAAATFSLRAWRGRLHGCPLVPPNGQHPTAVLSCTVLAFVSEHVCAAVFAKRPEHLQLLMQWNWSHRIQTICTTKANTTMNTAMPLHARTHLPLYIWPCGGAELAPWTSNDSKRRLANTFGSVCAAWPITCSKFLGLP